MYVIYRINDIFIHAGDTNPVSKYLLIRLPNIYKTFSFQAASRDWLGLMDLVDKFLWRDMLDQPSFTEKIHGH